MFQVFSLPFLHGRRRGWITVWYTMLLLVGLNFSFGAERPAKIMDFQSDIEFLQECTNVILLRKGSAAVAVAPA